MPVWKPNKTDSRLKQLHIRKVTPALYPIGNAPNIVYNQYNSNLGNNDILPTTNETSAKNYNQAISYMQSNEASPAQLTVPNSVNRRLSSSSINLATQPVLTTYSNSTQDTHLQPVAMASNEVNAKKSLNRTFPYRSTQSEHVSNHAPVATQPIYSHQAQIQQQVPATYTSYQVYGQAQQIYTQQPTVQQHVQNRKRSASYSPTPTMVYSVNQFYENNVDALQIMHASNLRQLARDCHRNGQIVECKLSFYSNRMDLAPQLKQGLMASKLPDKTIYYENIVYIVNEDAKNRPTSTDWPISMLRYQDKDNNKMQHVFLEFTNLLCYEEFCKRVDLYHEGTKEIVKTTNQFQRLLINQTKINARRDSDLSSINLTANTHKPVEYTTSVTLPPVAQIAPAIFGQQESVYGIGNFNQGYGRGKKKHNIYAEDIWAQVPTYVPVDVQPGTYIAGPKVHVNLRNSRVIAKPRDNEYF